jgi:hypothetical protein
VTEKEFIDAHEHEMMGWIYDANTMGLDGALRSTRLRELMRKVRQRLALMYQQLRPAPVNGPLTPVRKP